MHQKPAVVGVAAILTHDLLQHLEQSGIWIGEKSTFQYSLCNIRRDAVNRIYDENCPGSNSDQREVRCGRYYIDFIHALARLLSSSESPLGVTL